MNIPTDPRETSRVASLFAVRSGIACARAVLDEVETRLADGMDDVACDLVAQAADELTRVARGMRRSGPRAGTRS
jgi:hypothetical protein